MKIVVDYPPLIDRIDEVFQVRGKEIIYAWGDTIYNPTGIPIPDFLIEHERVHGTRQGSDILGWWEKYLADIKFRYNEELYSHAKEFQVRASRMKDRNEINRALMWSAARLAAPLYGNLTSINQAAQDIRKIYYPRVR